MRTKLQAVNRYYSRLSYHIFLVQQSAARLVGAGIVPEHLGADFVEMVAKHDASKYGPEECDGYIRYYSQLSEHERDEPAEQERFAPAWEHHKRHNPHHPQHWETPGKMGIGDVWEMCCDWSAMSIEKGSDLLNWVKSAIPRFELERYRTLIEEAATVLSDPEWRTHLMRFQAGIVGVD